MGVLHQKKEKLLSEWDEEQAPVGGGEGVRGWGEWVESPYR